MRISTLLMFGVCGLSGAGWLLAADNEQELKKFEGTWTLSSGEADGKPLTEKQLKGGTLVIKGDHYTVTIPGKEKTTGTQKVDPTKTPHAVDITDDSGPNKGKTRLGIYEFKGEEFHCVFSAAGKERPSKFSTAAGSGQWLHVWQRAKK
jgi:uncharacterized protein (TIGR03067 family)